MRFELLQIFLVRFKVRKKSVGGKRRWNLRAFLHTLPCYPSPTVLVQHWSCMGSYWAQCHGSNTWTRAQHHRHFHLIANPILLVWKQQPVIPLPSEQISPSEHRGSKLGFSSEPKWLVESLSQRHCQQSAWWVSFWKDVYKQSFIDTSWQWTIPKEGWCGEKAPKKKKSLNEGNAEKLTAYL